LLVCWLLLHSVAAQEAPSRDSGKIRLETGGAAQLTIDQVLRADHPASYDPFYDLRARPVWSSDEPVLQPALLLELPHSYFDVPAADQTSLWSQALRGRVDAIAQPTRFSISATTCQLGGSFADCMLPKLPCAFRLGVFGLGSQESHGPLVRESYDFNFLSSHCSL
jgi:hypothetical protein